MPGSGGLRLGGLEPRRRSTERWDSLCFRGPPRSMGERVGGGGFGETSRRRSVARGSGESCDGNGIGAGEWPPRAVAVPGSRGARQRKASSSATNLVEVILWSATNLVEVILQPLGAPANRAIRSESERGEWPPRAVAAPGSRGARHKDASSSATNLVEVILQGSLSSRLLRSVARVEGKGVGFGHV
jgi:hypothetical protein